MNYSFTKPRPKPLFVPNTKIWFAFMGVAIFMMIGFYSFLQFKSSDMLEKEQFYAQKFEEVVEEIATIDEQTAFMQKQKAFHDGLKAENVVLKDSVKNLFELIPDQITLSEVQMKENTLVLKGISPSKEVYSFLLAVPLKSIFTTSDAEFYMLTNSWYNFISVNTLEKDEVSDE